MYLKVIIALLIVICLIFLSSYLLNKLQYFIDKKNKFSNIKNLKIEEILYIDNKRKIVKLDSGDYFHLLLLGPTNDQIIHTIKKKEHE